MADQVMLDVAIDDKKDAIVSELQLSDQERQVLELYDALEGLRLETSYHEALRDLPRNSNDELVADDQAQAAKSKLLEAKALYSLRNKIVEDVLVANPVLQAVHAGNKATLIERDLLPLIKSRDELSIKLTSTNAKLLSLRENLLEVQLESAAINRQNAVMAEEMLKLAEDASAQRKEDIQDPEIRAQLDALETETKDNRQRWRMLKGMTSAVVAGSGIDWSRDQTLRDLVLDKEDDD